MTDSPTTDSPMTDYMSTPIKALVVGATGFCGRAITTRLAHDPRYHVTAHIRPESSRYDTATRAWSEEGVNALSCTWEELSEHLSAAPPELIISCIGITKHNARSSGATYASVDSGLNLSVIETARALPQPPLFVYISSAGVEWARWSAYLQARADVERALHEYELPHVILRPGALAGPSRDESRPLERVVATALLSLTDLMERCGLRSLAWRLRPLDAPEVAEIITALLDERLSPWLSSLDSSSLDSSSLDSSSLDSSSLESLPSDRSPLDLSAHQRVYELSELHQIRHARLS